MLKLLLIFFCDIMTDKSLIELELLDNIKFMIKYCDNFLDYCHEENLSIDGNIAGEIIDSVTEIEDYLENPEETINHDELQSIYDNLNDIYDGLVDLNDIKLFNNIHIVYSQVLKETKDIIEKNSTNEE